MVIVVREKFQTLAFAVSMFVLTIAFALVGTDANSRWQLDVPPQTAADIYPDKKRCILAAWQQRAAAGFDGCEDYAPFAAEDQRPGARLAAAPR